MFDGEDRVLRVLLRIGGWSECQSEEKDAGGDAGGTVREYMPGRESHGLSIASEEVPGEYWKGRATHLIWCRAYGARKDWDGIGAQP